MKKEISRVVAIGPNVKASFSVLLKNPGIGVSPFVRPSSTHSFPQIVSVSAFSFGRTPNALSEGRFVPLMLMISFALLRGPFRSIGSR